MLSIGVDPDLHNTSLVLVDDGGFPILVSVMEGSTKLTGDAAVQEQCSLIFRWFETLAARLQGDDEQILLACEAQQVYEQEKRKGKPEDLLRLARVTGAVAACANLLRNVKLATPLPRVWKGQVPKAIHHQRLKADLLALGGQPLWTHACEKQYRRTGAEIHLIDAYALSVWARSFPARAHFA